MKVKMNTVSAGPEGTAQIGEVIEVSAKEGKDLIAGGYASPVAEPAPRRKEKSETATQKTGETAQGIAGATSTLNQGDMNTVAGGQGDDTAEGGQVDDTVEGGEGADTVEGDNG